MRLPTVAICTTAALIQYNTLSAGAVSNLPLPQSELEASSYVVIAGTGSELPVQSVAPPAAKVAQKLAQKLAPKPIS